MMTFVPGKVVHISALTEVGKSLCLGNVQRFVWTHWTGQTRRSSGQHINLILHTLYTTLSQFLLMCTKTKLFKKGRGKLTSAFVSMFIPIFNLALATLESL